IKTRACTLNVSGCVIRKTDAAYRGARSGPAMHPPRAGLKNTRGTDAAHRRHHVQRSDVGDGGLRWSGEYEARGIAYGTSRADPNVVDRSRSTGSRLRSA